MAASVDLSLLFFSLTVIVFSLSVHEAAHAWAAYRLGDDTAAKLGRISLNPLVHIDPIGTILLPVIAFLTRAPLIGWAKPTPVRTRGLRHPRRDLILITLAGPLSNLLLASLAALALTFVPHADPTSVTAMGGLDVVSPIGYLLTLTARLNLLLAVFNMVPVPPLDGGNVLANLLPTSLAYRYEQLRPYGIFVLYGLVLTGLLSKMIEPPYVFLATLLNL